LGEDALAKIYADEVSRTSTDFDGRECTDGGGSAGRG
jgi:hypothetical protein